MHKIFQQNGNHFLKSSQLMRGDSLLSIGLNDFPVNLIEVDGEYNYDLRVRDQLAYIKYISENRLFNAVGNIKGKIKFEILNSKLSNGLGWFVLSTLTLYTINLLGVPIGSQNVELTLKCTIRDLNDNIIYSKDVNVKGKSHSALYWGYGMMGSLPTTAQFGIQRAANMKAISNAMQKLFTDIGAKSKQIKESLN
ncbi:MAG: hypothetical protein IPM92_05050 [Saprospiraceae bacterium]|nr:hypothetical protein [Saprospiraceae bacterium]